MIKHIIFKVTGNCNLSCDYCYYINDLSNEWKVNSNINILKEVFEKYRNYNNHLKISWHGGEPLLIGIDFFREAMKLAKTNKIKLTNSVQTNGILLNEEWCDFFLENNFSVGISIDGPQELHDKDRKMKNGLGSYQGAVNAIKLLQSKKIPYGILSVCSPTFNGKHVFNHFVELGIKNMDFLLPIITKESLINDRYFISKCTKYFLDILDEWIALDDPSIKIRYFRNLIYPLLGDKARECILNNSCNDFITIEPNGDVGLCENTRIINKDFYKSNLNICRNNFKEIEEYINNKINKCSYNKLCQACVDCKWLDICNGGYPVSRYDSLNDFNNTSAYCKLYKRIIAKMENYIERNIPTYTKCTK
ncbi:MAG TPA: hypothetical protein DCL31_00905 [Clostridium sp.]|nr:hypothetical protein [Clostridium sp.]